MKNIILTAFLIFSASLLSAADKTSPKAEPKTNNQTLREESARKAPVKKGQALSPETVRGAFTAKQALEGLVAWDEKLKTLQASFTQSTDFEGTPISSSEGKIYKQGQNIRLDTFENGALSQSALTDKKIIKIKDEQGRIITTMPWADWEAGQTNKALFDFGNYGEVVKNHKIKDFSELRDGLVLTLIPTDEQAGGYELSFKLDPKDFFVKEISLENEGVKTTTVLKETKKNIKLKESIFK